MSANVETLIDPAHDVLRVLGCPSTLGAVQSQIQGVLAHHTDRGEDLTEAQRKNNLRLLEDMKLRYWEAPDLSNVDKNGYRFINAVSDFATHADPIRNCVPQ